MAKEYSDLLRDRSKWGGEFDSDTPHDGASSMLVPGDAGCPTADKLALVVLLALEGAAGYDARFTDGAASWPMRLALLTQDDAAVDSGERRAVAAEMIQLLESTALRETTMENSMVRKLAEIFEKELRAAIESGKLLQSVWDVINYLVVLMSSDTQEIEGLNGIIKAKLYN